VREPIAEPDALIIQDPTLLHQVPLFDGLQPEGYVLINSKKSFAELGLAELELAGRRMTVPATDLAREHLGRPLPNAVLLGAFAAVTGVVAIDAVESAIRDKFSGKAADGNVAAARAAYQLLKEASLAPAD
jgi:pyruvate ferredoxin oxidoreductase gamma subunit